MIPVVAVALVAGFSLPHAAAHPIPKTRLTMRAAPAHLTATRPVPKTRPVTMRAAPPECVDKLDQGLLRACALSWLAVAAPMLADPSAVALDVFGLDVTGGYGVQQPAAGFLQLAGTLMPLESALLLLLSSGMLESTETRARVSASVTLAGVGVVGTGTAALATGLTVAQPAAVALVFALSILSGVTVLRPLLRESSAEELSELFTADARELLQGGTNEDDADGNLLSAFYRSSALASIVVGGAFMLSPVSP